MWSKLHRFYEKLGFAYIASRSLLQPQETAKSPGADLPEDWGPTAADHLRVSPPPPASVDALPDVWTDDFEIGAYLDSDPDTTVEEPAPSEPVREEPPQEEVPRVKTERNPFFFYK